MPDLDKHWEVLYNQVRRLVLRRIRDNAIVHDIVQAILIKVHIKAGQLQKAEMIHGWVYRITQNAIADYFRKTPGKTIKTDVESGNEENELNSCVSDCLAALTKTLPEKYRIAIELTGSGECSQRELALRLNLSHAGARSRVQRARNMLRKEIERIYVIRTDPYGNVIDCRNRFPCCCEK